MTWSNKAGASLGLIPGRAVLGPLVLLIGSPIFVIAVLFRTLRHLDGSLSRLWNELSSEGLITSMAGHWPTWQDTYVWKLLGYFLVLELMILRFVPGKTLRGPVSPAGNVPVYNANGFQAFTITIATFMTGAYFKFFNGGVLYDFLGEILATTNVFALAFCAVLYVKGRTFPSSTDCGSSGNIVFDYFWGMELYPRFFDFDVKQVTNCRFGMLFWPLFIVSALWKQHELYGTVSDALAVNAALQLVYIAKFFVWESGYYSTVDIMHDRAGFMLCWGCTCFLPCVYVSHTLYLVEHPAQIGGITAGAMLFLGLLFTYLNYDSDRQRMNFRQKWGKLNIWGMPATYVSAKYVTEKGDIKNSILLTSGYWGVSRHLNYVFEVLAALCWTAPVIWDGGLNLAFFYIPFLLILLLDRAYRDDARCESKYGKYWTEYCQAVPYRFLPPLL